MNSQKKPVFDTKYPFDCVKIINAVILGEPRLKFYPIKDNTFNNEYNAIFVNPEDLQERNVFKILVDEVLVPHKDDIIFADTIYEESKKFTTIDDYSHLFYTYGKVALQTIVTKLMGIPSVTSSEFELLLYKLHNTINEHTLDFQYCCGNTTKEEGEELHIRNDVQLINLAAVNDLLKKLSNANEDWNEIGDILAALYGSLSSLLLGITLKLANTGIIQSNRLFGADLEIINTSLNTFANSVIANQEMDVVSKNRYLSLLMFYYKLSEFYRVYAGGGHDDPTFYSLRTLGSELFGLPAEKLAENIDISILTQGDTELGSSRNIDSFLSASSFIESPSSYYINCLEYDMANRFIIAHAIFPLIISLDTETKIGIFKDKEYVVSYHTLMEEDGNDSYSEGNVLGLYNFFINNVMNKIVKNYCDPKLFHIVAMCALYFKKLSTKNLSKTLHEYVLAGLYQTEAVMTFLWHDWFRSGKFYNVAQNIQCASPNKLIYKIYKAQELIKIDVINYFFAYLEIKAPSYYTKETRNLVVYNLMGNNYALYYDATIVNKANTLIPTGKITTNTIMENAEGFNTSTGLTHLLGEYAFVKHDNYSIEKDVLAEKIYELYYDGDVPLIYLYSIFGIEKITYGLLFVKEILEKEYPEETLSALNDLDFDKGIIPFIVDNVLTGKIGQNISKVARGTFGTNKKFNMYFSILLRALFPIGFAREAMVRTIDEAEKLSFPGEAAHKEFSELNYEAVLPLIESQKAFTFLNRR